MSGQDDLLVRLARAIAATQPQDALTERLCLACRDLAGADAAALTVVHAGAERLTLFATDDVSARLEDLQEVMGQGPGVTAMTSGEIETCSLRDGAAHSPWPQFVVAAVDLVGPVTLHAVPMRPESQVLGVLTLYQAEHDRVPLALPGPTLSRLAAATGAALMRDPDATAEEVDRGPWATRAQIHQATGMVIAQLGVAPDDALAVLKAHAYAGNTTLGDVASRVVARSLRFTPPTERGR